jgi:GAF domain-containing protein
MSATLDQELAELRRANAVLRQERDAALEELQARTEALAQRNSEYAERIEQQSATIDVLKAMSNSPGDAQPVLERITRRAVELCGAAGARLVEFDGSLCHLRALVLAPEFETDADETLRRLYPSAPDRDAIDGRTILDSTIVHVRDPAELSPRWRGPLWGSVVGVPLLRDGHAVGAIVLARPQSGGFRQTQIELLQTFAEQAVIGIASAETYRALQGRTSDLQEALEQQIATAEVLAVINASPGNLAPVFDAILEKAHTLCGATLGSLVLYDGTHFRAAATHAHPEQYAAVVRQPQRPTRRTQPLIDGERFVHVLDMKANEEELDHEVARTRFERTDMRTALWMPLRKDGTLLGFISAFRSEVRAFTDRQIALLENFAAQAVIAMDNARLLTEQREALEQQTATADVLEVINASPGNLTPVFEAMLEKAMRLCGAAFGSFYTYDGDSLSSVAQLGVPPAYAEFRARNPTPIRPGTGIAQAIGARRPHKVLDLMTTEAYAAGEPAVRAMVELGGVRTLVAVPLCRDETVVGLITIYRQEVREFSAKQIALLENFAAQAVIAMDNARLLTEQREALERQTATAEVLQVINASPGDLTPVFDAMLEKAMRLCGAAYGVLRGFDGRHTRLLASRGVPSEYAEFLTRNAAHGAADPVPVPGTAFLQALQTGQPVQTLDARESVGYTSGAPGGRPSPISEGRAPYFTCHSSRISSRSACSPCIAGRSVASPTNRSPCWRTSRPRR